MKPARCCVLTQKGTRCANEPSPVRSSRMIGPVEIAACGLDGHQRAMRSLPDFVRHDAYCGAVGCDRPSNAGICAKHRDMYRDFGITEHMLFAQEAPMSEPITPAPADDGEPSEGDVADAPLFVGGTDSAPAELVARWGHVHTAPVQPMSPDLDGLAAPSPTVAELQAELKEATRLSECRRKEVQRRGDALARVEALLKDAEAQLNAITDALDDDPERSPAWDGDGNPIPLPRRVEIALMPDPVYERELRKSLHAVEAELFEVDRALHTLGAYGNGPTIDRLLQVLTPEDRRNILELQAAEARMDLARLRARRLNPAPPEKLAEYAAKVAALDARIAALDAG